MKGKILIFIFISYNILKITFQQPIIFPIDIDELDEEDKEDKDDLDTKVKVKAGDDDDDEKPIVETKEYKGKDGSHIKITRIHYNKSKNLKEDSEAITPFQMMKIFDDRVNSIFEDMIRESMGIKMLLNGLSIFNDDENEEVDSKNKTNDEKSIIEEFFEDDEEDEKNQIAVDSNNSNIQENDKNNEKKEKRVLKKENDKEIDDKKDSKAGQSKNNMDIKKDKKKLNRRELIFSRVCKYIFYSLILFIIYILIKRLLIFLEIIDPDNAVEVKVENDETSKLKKTSENKQS